MAGQYPGLIDLHPVCREVLPDGHTGSMPSALPEPLSRCSVPTTRNCNGLDGCVQGVHAPGWPGTAHGAQCDAVLVRIANVRKLKGAVGLVAVAIVLVVTAPCSA